MRCKNCTFWDGDSNDGWCNKGKIIERSYYDGGKDSVVYSYDEGGCFSVGPEFGCIHFEVQK